MTLERVGNQRDRSCKKGRSMNTDARKPTKMESNTKRMNSINVPFIPNRTEPISTASKTKRCHRYVVYEMPPTHEMGRTHQRCNGCLAFNGTDVTARPTAIAPAKYTPVSPKVTIAKEPKSLVSMGSKSKNMLANMAPRLFLKIRWNRSGR